MRYLAFLTSVLACGALATLVGCGGDDDADAACKLEASYRSVSQHECGLGPDGVVLCNWQLDFTPAAGDPTQGTFIWAHSDVGESGTYTCMDSTVTAQTGGGTDIEIWLDHATGILTWSDVAYEPAP